MVQVVYGWESDAAARAALGLAPSNTNFFTDVFGNVGPVTQSVAPSAVTPPASKIDWMLWLTVAGVGFAAMSYFKGR